MVLSGFRRCRDLSFIKQFSKNDIGWPQQPPTERMPKFNLTFHGSTDNFFFKHQNKVIFVIKLLNPRTWMSPKNSLVILLASATFQTSSLSVHPVEDLVYPSEHLNHSNEIENNFRVGN